MRNNPTSFSAAFLVTLIVLASALNVGCGRDDSKHEAVPSTETPPAAAPETHEEESCIRMED